MIYGAAGILFSALCLCIVKFRKKKSSEEDLMFGEELRKIKNDSVLNFIDEDFLKQSFELFGDTKFALAANDEGDMHYPVTNLQDLYPNDFA